MKKRGCFLVSGVLLLLLLLSFTGCASQTPTGPADDAQPADEPKETIVFKVITSTIQDDPTNMALWPLLDMITERSGGELVFDYVGGPEAIPSPDQFEALRSGVVDWAVSFEGFYGPKVTGESYDYLSPYKPWEEREIGYHDLKVDLLNEHNVYYLGRAVWDLFFAMYLNVPVETPDDLAGLRIRGAPAYIPLIESVNAVPVNVSFADIYGAMDRGVIDGYMWAGLGITDAGWHEVTDYMLAPRFYQAIQDNLINLDSWNKLPKHLQDLILECQLENESNMAPIIEQTVEDEVQKIVDSGIEIIEFSPADTEWIINMSYDAAWDRVSKGIEPPELAEKLMEMFIK